jgi:hypothetical protein
MHYNEWLELIERLRNTSSVSDKLKFINEKENNNIKDLLIPKIYELIKYKFDKAINKIISNINNIYYDVNYLDLNLVIFKKEVLFIYDLIFNNQLTDNDKEKLGNMLKSESNKVYDILLKKSYEFDQTGILKMNINNNRIKCSDKNEL